RGFELAEPLVRLPDLVQEGVRLLLVVLERALHHLELGADGGFLAQVAHRPQPLLQLLEAVALLRDRELESPFLQLHLLPALAGGAQLALEDQHRFLDLLELRIEVLDALPRLLYADVQLLEFLEGGSALLRHGLGSLYEWSLRGFRVAEPQ